MRNNAACLFDHTVPRSSSQEPRHDGADHSQSEQNEDRRQRSCRVKQKHNQDHPGEAVVISAKVAALTEGVVKAMLLNKLKSELAVTLALVLTVGGKSRFRVTADHERAISGRGGSAVIRTQCP